MAADRNAIELIPPAGEHELVAVLEAVARSGLEREAVPAAYASAWRAVALAEGAERASDLRATPRLSGPATYEAE